MQEQKVVLQDLLLRSVSPFVDSFLISFLNLKALYRNRKETVRGQVPGSPCSVVIIPKYILKTIIAISSNPIVLPAVRV